MKLSKVASSILAGTLAVSFIGCGGGGSNINNINTNNNGGDTISLKKVRGRVTDGPIGNAKVCIDENFDGNCSLDEPFGITDDKGNFSINYIAKDGEKLVLIAEDYDGNASDAKDHPGENLSFYMVSIGSQVNYDVNPNKMVDFLEEKNLTKIVLANLNKTNLNLDEVNSTIIFNELSKDRIIEKIVQQILQNKYQFDQNKKIFDSAKDKLDLDSKTDISIIKVDKDTTKDSDVNISKVSKNLPDKATPNVIPVGNGEAVTVAKELIPASKDKNSNFSYEVNETNKTADISPIVLDRPIFSMTTSFNDEIHAIFNNTFNDSSMTLFITPYNSILEIPKYHQLVDMGYMPLLAADITVRDSHGIKLSLSKLSNIQGIIEDNRKNAIDENVSNLRYLYFDGKDWIDNNISVDSKLNLDKGLAKKLKLAPYVIAKKNTALNKLYKDVSITIANADMLKNALIVVKGKSNSAVNNSNNNEIPLDYRPISNSSNVLTFTVPKDFNVTNIVILDKHLKEVGTTKDAVVSLQVKNNSADIKDELKNIATGENKKEIVSQLKNDFSVLGSRERIYENTKKLFLPWWMDENSTLKEDFYSVVKNCLIDGKCSDVNNTMPSIEFTDEYSKEEKHIVETSTNTIKLINEYVVHDKVEKYEYSYTFANYEANLSVSNDEENTNLSYKNVDKNNTISVVVNSNHKSDSHSSSPGDESYNYSISWNTTALANFKISKNINEAGLYYIGDLIYEVTGNIEINDNGDLRKYSNTYVKVKNQSTLLEAKGDYSMDNLNAKGKYVYDGKKYIITNDNANDISSYEPPSVPQDMLNQQ